MNIENGKVVSIHYTLSNDEGKTIDTSAGGSPLTYLHGVGQIVPGLEEALTGETTGANLSVKVPPAAGYGPRTGETEQVERSQFDEGIELAPGMPLKAHVEGHGEVVMWVEAVADDHVSISLNHPLAGMNLNFEVEILDVRDATPEEVEHGHAHSGDGHHHH